MDLFCCDVQGCMKAYKSKVNLRRHKEAIHSETKKYQCPHCSKILSSNQNLREHQLIHTQELPFACKVEGCEKRFRHGSQYSAHKRTHNPQAGLEKFDSKNMNIKLITGLLSRLKEYQPKVYFDMEDDPSFTLPSIGTQQEFSLRRLI